MDIKVMYKRLGSKVARFGAMTENGFRETDLVLKYVRDSRFQEIKGMNR